MPGLLRVELREQYAGGNGGGVAGGGPSRAAGLLGALTRPDQRGDGLLGSAVAVDVASDWQTRFQEAGDT